MSEAADDQGFTVELGGFQGPLDLLLDMARRQKVDLRALNLVALVDQFVAYLQAARRRELTVAADYLVMAAWLLWLKSRLLLPKEEPDEEAEEAVDDLEARLRRLDAIKAFARELETMPRLGFERLARGVAESFALETRYLPTASLGDLVAAHAGLKRRHQAVILRFPPPPTWSIDQAMARFEALVSGTSWLELESLLPPDLADGFGRRTALASGLVAGLELARQGRIELVQDRAFGPILVRGAG
ncbi:segregation and condensation protein A [Geminicoccus roseus]|uniref:segregation and condensation protein A n=1 Tax=Geminicoccus roseus TaxID=404900 RepID=UPI000420164B|nr:ScpA family protein [Geminicoccus roseus]